MTNWTDFVGDRSARVWFWARITGIPYVFSSIHALNTSGSAIADISHTPAHTVKSGSLKISDGMQSLGQALHTKAGIASAQTLNLTLCAGDYTRTDDSNWLHDMFARGKTSGTVSWLTETVADEDDLTFVVNDITGWSDEDYLYIGTETCQVNGAPSGSTITVTRAEFDSFGKSYTIDDNVQARKIYCTSYPSIWVGRYVKVWMGFTDHEGRVPDASFATGNSRPIFTGVLREISQHGHEYEIECAGLETLLDRKIARNLASSAVSLNADPYANRGNPIYDQRTANVRELAAYIDDSNKWVPVTVIEKLEDSAGGTMSEVTVAVLDGVVNDAPILYDGSAEVSDVLVFFENLVTWIARALDNVDWSGATHNFVNDPTFEGNLEMVHSFGTSEDNGWSNDGRIHFRWNGSMVDAGATDYYYDLIFHFDRPWSIGRSIGCYTRMDLNIVNTTQGQVMSANGDEAPPALFVPASSDAIPVVVPEFGTGYDFPSSGTLAVQDAIVSYTGYSQLNDDQGNAIPGVFKVTGLTTIRGTREPITVSFNEDFFTAVESRASTPTNIYAEDSKIAVKEVLAIVDKAWETALLQMMISGSGDGSASDTLPSKHGAGIRGDVINGLELVRLRQEIPFLRPLRTYIFHKPITLRKILQSEAQLVGGVWSSRIGDDGAGSHAYGLTLTKFREPTDSISAITIGTGDVVWERPPEVRLDLENPITSIVVEPVWDPVKGAHTKDRLTYNFLSGQEEHGDGATLKIKSYDCNQTAYGFNGEWLAHAMSLFILFGEATRKIMVHMVSRECWKVKIGDPAKITHPYILDQEAATMGLTGKQVAIYGLQNRYFSHDPVRTVCTLVEPRYFRRANWGPACKVSSYDSGTKKLTVAANNFVPASTSSPIGSTTLGTAKDIDPFDTSYVITVYEAGRYADTGGTFKEDHVIAAIDKSANTITLTSALHSDLQTALTAGDDIYVVFDDYDDGSIVAAQQNWLYQSTDTHTVDSDVSFKWTA